MPRTCLTQPMPVSLSGQASLGEEAVVFSCQGDRLLGVLHPADSASRLGILIVTGGPQYRIGSHRQYVLLARAFAAAGIPTFRFDYRGMGDSEGAFLGFEGIDDDIEAAITTFLSRCAGLERVVLWGLCDAASAITFYGAKDHRVAGILLVNPWVRSDQSQSQALVKHYYRRRLLQPEFWRKLVSGRVALASSLGSFTHVFLSWLRVKIAPQTDKQSEHLVSLPQRMGRSLSKFNGPVAIILSGEDLTAREFEGATSDPLWKGLLGRDNLYRHDLPRADHTFSRRVWREEIAAWTLRWLKDVEEL